MLEKLKLVIKKKGLATVASGLGYRSATTVTTWISLNKIPEIAEEKVKTYLEKEGKK